MVTLQTRDTVAPRGVGRTAPLVTVIVVSYNTRELTVACIRSVLEETRRSQFEVIVVDNASADGSAEAIAESFPQVQLIRSDLNLGFAKANNLAANHAKGRYLLLLNPDTVVLDGAVDRLLGFAASRAEAGIWGGRTLFADGSLNPTSCWGSMSLWSLFALATGLTALGRGNALLNPEGYGSWQRDEVREVDVVTGCLLLIRCDLWDRLGGFDEDFFMYAEEADLCFRARQIGARPLLTPDAAIIHYDGASDRVPSARMIKLLSGKVLFMRKHWTTWKRVVGIALLRLHVVVRVVADARRSRVHGRREV